MSNTKKKPKPIPPSKNLTKYLKETLSLEKLKAKKLDGKTPLSDLDPRTRTLVRNNDGKKVWYMDKLLESMANLIYFFEFINEHQELIDKFSDDIEDLLGLKPLTDRKHAVLPRFISAIIGEGRNWSDFDNEKVAYRYHLVKIIQYLINRKAMEFFANPDNPDYQKDRRYKDFIWKNLMQTEMYMRLADTFRVDVNDKPNRIIGF